MTPAYIVPQRERRAYRFSPLRVMIMSLLLFLLAVGCLYLYRTAFREYGTYLTENEKKTTAWIVEQVSYMLPFITIAVFQYAVYAKHDNRDGVLQRERAYEILVAALLIYLVLLPIVCHASDALLKVALVADLDVDKNAGKEYETLLLSVAEWFIRLAIPLSLLFVYHRARAHAEISEKQVEVEASEKAEDTAISAETTEAAPEAPAAEGTSTKETSLPLTEDTL